MRRLILILVTMIVFCFSSIVLAKQTSANNSDVKNTCEVSGGKWTESASGWACCWADWGCYGCVNGHCKIKCTTTRCKKANQIGKPGKGEKKIEGLAPAGEKAPIAPDKNKKKMTKTSEDDSKIKQEMPFSI